TLSIAMTAILQLILAQQIYFQMLTVTWMMHILLIGGARFAWRVYRDTYIRRPKIVQKGKPTLIIGAGSAGTMVARQLKFHLEHGMYPVGFIDDDPLKRNLALLGLPVLGGRDRIEEIVKAHGVQHIIIAIPSLKK